MVKLTIIIPCYNEEKAIADVIQGIQELVSIPYELIVVDDASTDDSIKVVEGSGVKLIRHKQNKGYSSALKTGLKAAKGEYILIIDGDGTYPTTAINGLLEHLDYDMVVGQRNMKNVPFMRKPAKLMLRLLANYLVNKNIPDLNSGLRVFRKDLAMEFMHLYPQKFSFTTTITLAFLTKGYSVKYVPVDYLKRIGKSSIKPTDFLDFIQLIIRIMAYFNPIKMFGTVSAMLIGAAFLVFLFSYFVLGNIMDVTIVVMTLAALQIFFNGIIADLIVRCRR